MVRLPFSRRPLPRSARIMRQLRPTISKCRMVSQNIGKISFNSLNWRSRRATADRRLFSIVTKAPMEDTRHDEGFSWMRRVFCYFFGERSDSCPNEFLVVRDSTTKKCTVVDAKPTSTTTTVVENGQFPTKEQAETAMKGMKVCE